MNKQKREPTPITEAMKNDPENPTNPTLYAQRNGFKFRSLEAVTQGRRFNKEIILQLLVDGYVNEVIETFKDKGGDNVQ